MGRALRKISCAHARKVKALALYIYSEVSKEIILEYGGKGELVKMNYWYKKNIMFMNQRSGK